MLYIINPEKYKEYLELRSYKYIFPLFTPMFKTKILEDIIIDNNLKGKVVGINLKPVDYRNENCIKRFIANINKLKDESDKNIYIEGIEKYPLEIKKTIEAETDLIFPEELDLKLSNIKFILEEILKDKNFLIEEEVLIVCKDKDIVSKIIMILYEKFSFVSILPNIEDGDNICEDILSDTGLSVFSVKDIDKSIKNYGIIINIEKEPYIDVKKIRKDAIVFDFSNSHEFRNEKNFMLIEDISIKYNCDKKAPLLPMEFASSLYENLTGNDKVRFSKIYSGDRLYTLDALIKCKERLKGNI